MPLQDAAGFGEVRALNLGVRLAETEAEIDAAQALRYKVFYGEMGAIADPATAASQRDVDGYDAVADHLLVIDHDRGDGPNAVVGTYRLIQKAGAAQLGGFYSESEYDLAALIALPGKVMELGRSCVDEAYRTRAALQLLWRGIAAYVWKHDIEVMFGCASLHGTDLDVLAPQLTYLYTHHLAPEHLRPRAVADRYVDMRRMDPAALNLRTAALALPPLIKGYLRLGGFVGDGAVLDPQFNTTDVCIVVKTDQITKKYSDHYDRHRD